ncbi:MULTISPECIES: AbrB family transcriptional regulator [unclassified Bradyrhizobium]|uniref:AbrB family transcriptional regulator n=1 Tax=unclassified Bradyrhizobium TaxID=2631580 RepID=UPI00247A6E44|nr:MULTISPECIES: AbrB family transcriptional regulator [unclassified Bradyrhizobium]WGS19860.1 AbrB family transcriptional regulator [Bradyrhizobium sp. ISRA463]WGS26711.1 AbrB family transcriptional regulator [Bradyrhizobium sp. ISRA464]
MTLIRASIAPAVPSRAKLLSALETIVIGSAGGLLFFWAQLPGGLISGAMSAVAIAALMGRPLAMPPVLTQSVLLLLGISLGSLMSQQLLQHMGSYPLTIGLLALATFCSTFGSSYYLQRVHGWDQTSAFLAGSPGALSQITILAAEKDADVAGIAVVQTMRVIILTAALPIMLAVTGVTHAAQLPLPTGVASPLGLAALIAASIGAALLLRWVKFPASWMFGAMLASSLLHGAGLVDGGLPPWIRNVALVGIGAVIGTRFARMKTSTLLRHVNAGIGSFAIAILISAVFVMVIAFTTHVRLADIVVAFAPGAMDAMLALALTLHIDPIFVGAHHLSRFVFVTVSTPGIIHLFGRPQDDVDD